MGQKKGLGVLTWGFKKLKNFGIFQVKFKIIKMTMGVPLGQKRVRGFNLGVWNFDNLFWNFSGEIENYQNDYGVPIGSKKELGVLS